MVSNNVFESYTTFRYSRSIPEHDTVMFKHFGWMCFYTIIWAPILGKNTSSGWSRIRWGGECSGLM